MNRILIFCMAALMAVSLHAASPFVDFSAYRNLDGVRYIYFPGTMTRQVRLVSNVEGFTPTTFSEVDGILMLLPTQEKVTNTLIAKVTNIAKNKAYQTHYESTLGTKSTTLLLHPIKDSVDVFDEMIFFSNEKKKVLIQLMGRLRLGEVQDFLNSYIAGYTEKRGSYSAKIATPLTPEQILLDLEQLRHLQGSFADDSLQLRQWASSFPIDSLQFEKLVNHETLSAQELASVSRSLRKWAETMPATMKNMKEQQKKIQQWVDALNFSAKMREKAAKIRRGDDELSDE